LDLFRPGGPLVAWLEGKLFALFMDADRAASSGDTTSDLGGFAGLALTDLLPPSDTVAPTDGSPPVEGDYALAGFEGSPRGSGE
jgi:hypothetical protein